MSFTAPNRFNTQPPEGGWSIQAERIRLQYHVSTHSRPKAAGVILFAHRLNISCFNTQPPEGGWERLGIVAKDALQFQHTAARRRLEIYTKCNFHREKFQHTAARRRLDIQQTSCSLTTGFNTQPPEGGWSVQIRNLLQHEVSTHSRPKAAGQYSSTCRKCQAVSTHSRPKAAGLERNRGYYRLYRFNTQPPEGGWFK